METFSFGNCLHKYTNCVSKYVSCIWMQTLDCALCMSPYLFLCANLRMMCVTCVCLTVVGQISVVGVLCGWTSRQHYASNLTATTHIQTARERKTAGERDGGREYDRRTEGDGPSGPQNMEYGGMYILLEAFQFLFSNTNPDFIHWVFPVTSTLIVFNLLSFKFKVEWFWIKILPLPQRTIISTFLGRLLMWKVERRALMFNFYRWIK